MYRTASISVYDQYNLPIRIGLLCCLNLFSNSDDDDDKKLTAVKLS